MVFGSRSSRNDRSYRSNNDRSRSHNSPPIASRVSSSSRGYDDRTDQMDYDDYRHSSRRDEAGSGSNNGSSRYFSNFYRERFGSHSPEDYRNLRISQFDRSLSKNDIRILLEQEFRSMTPFEIKIVRNPEDDERLAYVNFERDNCAKTIRAKMIPRLHRVLGRRLVLDPTGVIRDQEGKYIPDRYNRAVMAGDRYTPPSQVRSRRRSYSRDAESRSHSRTPTRRISTRPSRDSRESAFSNLVQDDDFASRTLFVGNLPSDVRESELRRVFEVYGKIDEVDVKNMAGATCYAFVLYRKVEDAIEARRCQHNKPMRPGSTRCQIGYGKTQASSRLYVGGLGMWTNAEMLMEEFDRYGAIEEVEYDSGQTYAYIRFVDMDSACDACSRMKNFELKSGKFITVDFAKNIPPRERGRKRIRSASAEDEALDTKRQDMVTRAWSPTSAGYVSTVDELHEQFACTWKGFVTLKKVDYPLAFHRIYGKEHLLQDYLRDDAGTAIKLNITQRLKMDNNYYQEVIEIPPRELALMIAVDGTPSAERVVHYLQEKGASGLVILGECSVNILPQSPVSERLLNFFAPRIAVMKASPNYMLVVLRKTRKEKVIESAVKIDPRVEPSETHTTSYKLQPPPPLTSLRMKVEADDDKLEQIHQERLQLRAKFKKERSPILLPAPAPPDLSALANGAKKEENKVLADSTSIYESPHNNGKERKRTYNENKKDKDAQGSSESAESRSNGDSEDEEFTNSDESGGSTPTNEKKFNPASDYKKNEKEGSGRMQYITNAKKIKPDERATPNETDAETDFKSNKTSKK